MQVLWPNGYIEKQISYVSVSLNRLLKAAVWRFSSLSPSLFEICNCSHLRNYQLYVSCSSTPLTLHSVDEHNVWGECDAGSRRAGVDTVIESQIIIFGSITNIRIFLPENVWTSKKHPLLFWFWHCSKLHWLNLTITYKLSYHAKLCKLYFILKLLMLTMSASIVHQYHWN